MTPDEPVACGITVRPLERDVVVNGQDVALTAREFEIVSALADHPGWVFSADQLSDSTAGDAYSPESVSVHIARLRHKLALAGADDAIETVRGLGYRIRSGGDPAHAEAVGPCQPLRNASWQLAEAILEVEHSGSDAQRNAACDELERARHRIYAILAE